MSLSRLCIQRPVGTIMGVVCAMVLGFFALTQLSVDFLPRIIYPRIFIGVDFEGADPAVVEEQVTKVLEREMATTQGLVRIFSLSREGSARLWMFFDFDRDIDLALQDAITKFNVARRNLPDEIQAQLQNTRIFKSDPAQVPIVEFALSSKSMRGPQLQTWARKVLIPQLMVVPGIASVEAFGGQAEEIQVLVDFPRMQGLGLSLPAVLRRMRSENMDMAAGRIETAEREYASRTAGKLKNPAELSNLIFPTEDGRRVYLRDFAKVEDGGRERRIFVWLNGEESIKVVALKQPDANTISVVDGLRDRMGFLRRYGIVPDDITFTPISDQSFFIRASIKNVLASALVGGLLAILVVIVFLGSLRRTFIIGLAIPVVSLFTFFLMWMGGFTFNIFSLGGVALGVGMLVDNAIVMLENISRHQSRGDDPVTAAEEGAREVESAMVASTMTNVAAVLPFLLVTGYVALLFRELILTITIAFVGSLLVGLTIVAMLSARLLQLPMTSGLGRFPLFRFFAWFVGRLNAIYHFILGPVLRVRWLVIVVALVACSGSYFLLDLLGNELLPQVDDGRVTVDIRFSPGGKLEDTKEATRQIHDMLLKDPEVKHVFATAGGRLFGRNFSPSASRGRIQVNLKQGENVFAYVKKLHPRLSRLQYPDARIYAYKSRVRGLRTSNSRHNKGFSLGVRGDDLTIINRIAEEVVDRLQGVPGLNNVQMNEDRPRPEFHVEVNRERAAELGLSVEEVGETVSTAIDGSVATHLNRLDLRVPVRVMLADTEIKSEQDLENLPLFPVNREPTRLNHVAHVKYSQGSSYIVRVDQNRLVQVTGDISGRSLGDISRDVRARLAGIKLPRGYFILPGDDEENLKKSNRELLILAMLALFMVYTVMAVQYDSLVNPFVIIFAVPPALSGAILGLYLTGTSFGSTVLIGVILLVGIVVNSSIVMVDYIERLRKRGLDLREAIVQGASTRLRPILMTTLTTVFALIPLSLGWGQGSEMLRPLGIVVLSGLSLSTLFILFLVPSIYMVAQNGVARLRSWVGLGPRQFSASG
ncbi:efflux RND transporter permease subunit [Nitrospinota bacterium]